MPHSFTFIKSLDPSKKIASVLQTVIKQESLIKEIDNRLLAYKKAIENSDARAQDQYNYFVTTMYLCSSDPQSGNTHIKYYTNNTKYYPVAAPPAIDLPADQLFFRMAILGLVLTAASVPIFFLSTTYAPVVLGAGLLLLLSSAIYHVIPSAPDYKCIQQIEAAILQDIVMANTPQTEVSPQLT